MLNNQIEIAVRLYDNNTYGSTYGRGLYRKAIYNGTIDAKHSSAKYLVDFYTYEDWANQAKTDQHAIEGTAVGQYNHPTIITND